MKNILFVISVLALLLIPAFHVSAQTCAISTGHGLLQDVDCDKVPDIYDNCPGIFNPDQADNNKNGVGDPCDQFYASWKAQFQPQQVSQPSQPKVVYVQEKKVEQPKPVQVEKKPVQTLSEEAFPYATVLTEQTQVKLLSQQDVAAGGAGVVYPIRILNKADHIKQYSLIAFNMDAFGTYRFDPGSVVLIYPNEEKTVYLYIQADSTARLGEHAFTVRLESGDEQAQAILRADVFGDKESSFKEFSISDRLGVILLTVLVLILLAALVIVLSRRRGNSGSAGRKVRYSHY